MGVFTKFAADQFRTAQHVAPLIISAELHITSIFLEQHIKIVALHDHIVKFQEGQTFFHALLIAVGPQHIVHGEAGSHFAEQLHIVEAQKPIGIVHHHCFVLTELNEVFHLPLETGGIVVDIFLGQHLPHICTAGRISDHSSTPADEGNRFVPCHLQALHQRQRHKMSRCQTVCGAVKADIEHCFPRIDHTLDLFFVGDLGDQTSGL